jgi:uncharacterized membrane protein
MFSLLRVPRHRIAAILCLVNRIIGVGDANSALIEIQADLNTTLRRLNAASEHALSPAYTSIEPEFSLLAPANGYLQRIDYEVLTQAAVASRAVITFLRRPGDFVLERSVLAVGNSDGSQLPLAASIELLQRTFAEGVVVGRKRTPYQDPEYAIARILEIGLLAMSPAINDPFTTLRCVDALTASLRDILQAAVYNRIHCDGQGQARVFEKNTPPEQILSVAFDPLRQATKNSVELTIRVLDAIASLAPFLNTPNQSLELRAQAELMVAGACTDAVLRDRSAIEAAYLRARQALASPSCRTKIDLSSATWQQTGFSETPS